MISLRAGLVVAVLVGGCQSPSASLPGAQANELLAAADGWISATVATAAPRTVGSWSPDVELQQVASQLQTHRVALDNPCGATIAGACVRSALDPFFVSLDALATRRSSTRVVVSAFGNSLIAGDKVIDRVRLALTQVFGDGGRGLLLVDRMASYGPRSRTGEASSTQWSTTNIGKLKKAPYPLGLTGIYHQAAVSNARSRYPLHGERAAAVWWVDVKGGGALQVIIDGATVVRTAPTGTGQAFSEQIEIPAGAKLLELVAQKGALVHGVVLDGPLAGVVVDTLGVPSADASLFLEANEAMVQAQLAERDPKLLMFMFGGNEAKRIQWERATLGELEADTHRLIKRAQLAAPQSACLVVGPLDATDPKGRVAFEERPYLQPVIEMERQVAFAEGCAFFNLYEAMGGKGALKRFAKAGLLHDDRVHPRGQGLDVLGELIAQAMLASWVQTPAPIDEAVVAKKWAALVAAAKVVGGDVDVDANAGWMTAHGWLGAETQTFTERGRAGLAIIARAAAEP